MTLSGSPPPPPTASRSQRRQPPPPASYSSLRRRSSLPLWAGAVLRTLLVLALVAMAIAVHWFDREGLVDNADHHVSFIDVVYFTMISITTTGYGDIAPVTERARLFDALIVTPIRIFVVLIFIGTAYNFVLKRTWERWKMRIIQRRLADHVVLVGFGISGEEAVRELIARGQDPRQIVVIDCDPTNLPTAEALGCNVLAADGTRDQSLLDARVETAASAVVSVGSDDTAILIVLTIRHLAPSLPISVVVRAKDNELLARQAGATNVINPVNFAGLLLAGSAHGEHIADYIADLASASGRVALNERPVAATELGRSLRELEPGVGVRLFRAGRAFGFWEPEADRLQAGDVIVEIVPATVDARA